MPNPSRTLREIADLTHNPAIREKAEQLAAELELQHNRQNNEFGVALGMAELSFANQFDSLRAEIAGLRTDQDHSAERQRTILEMLETLQTDVRALTSRVLVDPYTDGAR